MNAVSFLGLGAPALPEFSQNDFGDLLGNTRGPVLAAFWRPWCFVAALTWPGLRALAVQNPSLVVAKVKLLEPELPAPTYRIRWLPVTVLFDAGGRVRGRWYGGELDWKSVQRAVDRVRLEATE